MENGCVLVKENKFYYTKTVILVIIEKRPFQRWNGRFFYGLCTLSASPANQCCCKKRSQQKQENRRTLVCCTHDKYHISVFFSAMCDILYQPAD